MPIITPEKPMFIDLSQKDAAEIAATVAVEQAEEASKAGTFGVGGLLMDNKVGEVLAIARNHVIQDGAVEDPTAHVERQLIDWYYQRKGQGVVLPPSDNLTIVSSLDPCVMCGGAILETGFNVVSVTRDSFAGVGLGSKGKDFSTMLPSLRLLAKGK